MAEFIGQALVFGGPLFVAVAFAYRIARPLTNHGAFLGGKGGR